MAENPFPRRFPAPSLEGGLDWLNAAGPLDLKDLQGKVVLIDFWTYCCINCIHMLAVLEQLEKKYPNELVVIGVHSAKFDTEKDSENIRKAVLRYGITHPVVNDADFEIWRRYETRSWPSLRLIDPEGFLVAGASGEIPFDVLDQVIAKLIAYHKDRGTLDETPLRFELEQYSAAKTPLRFPGKVLADAKSNRLFIADSSHNRLVIASLEGEVQAVIGTGVPGTEDGPYNRAMFNEPQGMALDGETLYVADTKNHMIRVVDLESQKVETLAGTGKQTRFGGLDDPAKRPSLLETDLNSPWALQLVGSNLYIAMAGPHQIWVLKLDEGVVRAYAGSGREDILNGSLEESAFAQPSGLATDGVWLYVADSEGSAIRAVPLNPKESVTTLVGTEGLPRGRSLFEFGDRDGVGPDVRLQHPLGIALHEGLLYVADTYNHKIKRIDPEKRTSEAFLGDGERGTRDAPPRFHEPAGLSVAEGKLYIADTNNHLIRVCDLATGTVQTLELRGLEPPAPKPRSGAGFPNAVEVDLESQRVNSEKQVTFAVEIQLPEGFKLNSDAPMGYQLDSLQEQGIADRSGFGRFHRVNPATDRFEVSVPLTGGDGEDHVRLSVVYYSCRGGAEGVCKIESAIWNVPIEVTSAVENDRIELSLDRSSAGQKTVGAP